LVMIKLFTLLFVLIGYTTLADVEGTRFVQPDNKNIVFEGAFFIEKSSERVIINRFNKTFLSNKETFVNPTKANMQSGASVAFSTNSPVVSVFFEERDDAQHRQKVFGIYKNGKFFKKITGMEFTLENDTRGEFTEWKIVLPSFCGVNFKGIEIATNAELKAIKQEQKPVYVMMIEAVLPTDLEVGEVESWMEELKTKLQVDISVRSLATLEL